ncbi:MAG: amidohydrolase [Proteobacteria bacterium]|nr:amidohydrolase [Pseudomonadota bacterium]
MSVSSAIDADGHVMEPPDAWARYLPSRLHSLAPTWGVDNQGRSRQVIGGKLQGYIPQNPEWATQRRPGGMDPKARLADMDEEGLAVSVLFPTTGLYFAGIEDLELQREMCRAYNDWLHDFCTADPARLVGVAVVPQGDVAACIAEAQRAVGELGFKGVMLRPNPIRGRNLDDPTHEPLWSALEDLDVVAAIHEGTTQDVVQVGRDRFDNFMFRHALSHPIEMQIACLSLICGGVLERHPRLRVVFLESGCGWAPYWLERLDEHMEEWGHASMPLPLEPTEYFKRQCFISAEPDERALPGVILGLGDDNLLFASDYPHPDGIFPGVVSALADRDDLSESTKAKVLRDNALRCFGLS